MYSLLGLFNNKKYLFVTRKVKTILLLVNSLEMTTMKDIRSGFFTNSIYETDSSLFNAIEGELRRQRDEIELIASENIVSRAVLEVQGSVMTNKNFENLFKCLLILMSFY